MSFRILDMMGFKARAFCFFQILALAALFSCRSARKSADRAKSHHQIAVSLIGKCDNPRALSHLLKALDLQPEDFLIRHTLAVIYYDMGQYGKALRELKRALLKRPDFTEARVGMARALISLNKPAQALKEIKKAEQDLTYTDSLKIVKIKSLAYYEKGDYKRAEKHLREMFSFPGRKGCFPFLMMGKTQLALGQIQESEKLLNQALSVCASEKRTCRAPDYTAYMFLARLYIKKGDRGKARRYLGVFLEKSRDRRQIRQAEKLLKGIP